MQESPGLNPDWFGKSRLFLEKKVSNVIKQALKYFSTNRFYTIAFDSLFTTLTFSHSSGNQPFRRHILEMIPGVCKSSHHKVLTYECWSYHGHEPYSSLAFWFRKMAIS